MLLPCNGECWRKGYEQIAFWITGKLVFLVADTG